MAKSMKGRFYHNIDAKGRLIIPAKLRDSIGTEFVITVGIDKCLSIYSEDAWEEFTENLDESLKNSKEKARKIKRHFRANAIDCEMDSQGRAVISPELRAYAGIKKEVVIIGNGDKAEIWDREIYENEELASEELSRESISNMLEEMDIDF